MISFAVDRGSFGAEVPLLEQKLHLRVMDRLLQRAGIIPRVPLMTTLQAICLGAMLAWTPSLIVMAWLLHDAPLDELERDPS
jgi:hypothetical protein